MLDSDVLLGLAVAFAVGMLVGIERERSKGQGPDREIAGLRTFTLASLVGAISFLLGSVALFAVFALLLGLVVAAGYLRSREHDPGLTTEIALLATFLLGGLAMRERQLAAALAVAVTIVLAARTRLHDWVHNVLTDDEVRDGLMLAAAALIILPLTPSEPVDPWGIVSLRQLWLLVVLVMAINALGYIALRALGPRIGLSLAGLFGGFVSSTATIGAMGARTRKHPELHAGAVAGAAASSVATVVQLAIVVGLVSLSVLKALILSLIAAGLAAFGYATAFAWRSARQFEDREPPAGRPFDPKTAIVFMLIVGAAILVSAGATHLLGDQGLIIASGLAGFADTHAAAISAATLAAGEKTSTQYSTLAILVAFSTNAVSKSIVAFSMGNRQYALELLPGLLLMVAGAWAGWFALQWLG
ncbi:MAG: MgtC/SapB family protein [Xanthomonadaceae bacterium]|nr:MgtC/SapB family protein [Xanthomonadaceae bacterium]